MLSDDGGAHEVKKTYFPIVFFSDFGYLYGFPFYSLGENGVHTVGPLVRFSHLFSFVELGVGIWELEWGWTVTWDGWG